MPFPGPPRRVPIPRRPRPRPDAQRPRQRPRAPAPASAAPALRVPGHAAAPLTPGGGRSGQHRGQAARADSWNASGGTARPASAWPVPAAAPGRDAAHRGAGCAYARWRQARCAALPRRGGACPRAGTPKPARGRRRVACPPVSPGPRDAAGGHAAGAATGCHRAGTRPAGAGHDAGYRAAGKDWALNPGGCGGTKLPCKLPCSSPGSQVCIAVLRATATKNGRGERI